jgi:hypothetical protein
MWDNGAVEMPEASAAMACERCGDYAALSQHGAARLCAACVARAPLLLDGALALGRTLRDTFRMTGRARGAVLVLPLLPALYVGTRSGLGALIPSPSLLVLVVGMLDVGWRLLAMTFMAAHVVADLDGVPARRTHALRLVVRALPALLGFVVLVQIPHGVDLLLEDGIPEGGSGAQLVSGLLLAAGVFVPALLVMREPSLLLALRDSPAIFRAAFKSTVLGLGLLTAAALIVQQVLGVVLGLLYLAVAGNLLDPSIFTRSGDVAMVLTAPLLGYVAAFRTVLALQCRARGVVS